VLFPRNLPEAQEVHEVAAVTQFTHTLESQSKQSCPERYSPGSQTTHEPNSNA